MFSLVLSALFCCLAHVLFVQLLSCRKLRSCVLVVLCWFVFQPCPVPTQCLFVSCIAVTHSSVCPLPSLLNNFVQCRGANNKTVQFSLLFSIASWFISLSLYYFITLANAFIIFLVNFCFAITPAVCLHLSCQVYSSFICPTDGQVFACCR